MANDVLKVGEHHENRVKLDVETRKKLRTISDFKIRTRSVNTAWTNDFKESRHSSPA